MYGKQATAPCGHPGETIIGSYVKCLQGCDANAVRAEKPPQQTHFAQRNMDAIEGYMRARRDLYAAPPMPVSPAPPTPPAQPTPPAFQKCSKCKADVPYHSNIVMRSGLKWRYRCVNCRLTMFVRAK